MLNFHCFKRTMSTGFHARHSRGLVVKLLSNLLVYTILPPIINVTNILAT